MHSSHVPSPLLPHWVTPGRGTITAWQGGGKRRMTNGLWLVCQIILGGWQLSLLWGYASSPWRGGFRDELGIPDISQPQSVHQVSKPSWECWTLSFRQLQLLLTCFVNPQEPEPNSWPQTPWETRECYCSSPPMSLEVIYFLLPRNSEPSTQEHGSSIASLDIPWLFFNLSLS